MAERLFYRWQISEKESQTKILDKFVQILDKKRLAEIRKTFYGLKYSIRIKELEEDKIKLQNYLEIALKENEALDKQKSQNVYEIDVPTQDHTKNKLPSNKPPPQSESRISNNKSQQKREGPSIFDKLHEEAMTKLEIKQLNEEIKKQRELQFCTFAPTLKDSPKAHTNTFEESKNVYNRLAQSNKFLKMQYYDAQKQAQELQFCTFQPDLPKAKRDPNRNMSLQLNDTTGNIHERLHKEAEVLSQQRQTKAFAKREKELDGCTFTPTINLGKRSNSQHIPTHRFEELYREHERKRTEQTKKEMLKDEKTMESCTFKPSLLSKTKDNLTMDESSTPRYEKLYNKHTQKLMLLEQKRKELAEEERKMRQFVAKEMKIPANKRQANNTTLQASHSKTMQSEDSKKGKDDSAFDRLYKIDKVYRQNKKELSQKVMKERGISFTPRTNPKPIAFNEKELKGVIERNEEFLKEKNSKLAKQIPTELKECTFAPVVQKSGSLSRGNSKDKVDFADRLYSYFDKYEKRKEEIRQKNAEDYKQ